jgi:hypothetical protein
MPKLFRSVADKTQKSVQGASMKISVIFADHTSGTVNSEDLERLIQMRKIQAFRRSGNWVWVSAHDQLRGNGGKYAGKDRRGR